MKKNEMTKKTGQLTEIRYKLAEEFPWSRNIPREFINRLQSWYCLPESKAKPTIINLWGMTGVGKTTFARELVNMLEMKKCFFEFDARQSNIHSDLISTIKSLATISQPVRGIFLIDNFHYFLKNQTPPPFESPSSKSPIWRIFDDGKLTLQYSEIGYRKIREVYDEFMYWFKKGILIEKGLVSDACKDFFIEKQIPTEAKPKSFQLANIAEDQPPQFIFSRYEAKTLYNSKLHDCHSYHEFLSKIRTMDGDQIKAFLDEMMMNVLEPETIELSQCLFILVGSLDELANEESHLDFEEMTEEFESSSKKITQKDIQRFLTKSIGNHQLSRLGSHYLFFPSLPTMAYYKVIDKELSKISTYFEKKTQIPLRFENGVLELIFEKGVEPSLGLRPLLSTIDHLIGNFIPTIIMSLEIYNSIKSIEVYNSDNGLEAHFIIEGKNPIKLFYPI